MSAKGPILVAVDLSSHKASPSELGCTLAKALERPLILLHVLDVGADVDAAPASVLPALHALEERLEERVSEARDEVERQRAACVAAGVKCEAILTEGRPWEAILEHASLHDASMIVVGAHQHGRKRREHPVRRELKERILGSTADRVVHHATCPVVVTPEDA